MEHPTNQLQYTTVRVIGNKGANSQSVGTAFFFRFELNPTSYVPLLVTNIHVIAGCTEGTISFHEAITRPDGVSQASSNSHTITLTDFEQQWLKHPTEDLCAMRLGPIITAAQEQGKSLFYVPLRTDMIATEEQLSDLLALEEVVMVGYPNGLWDEVNNLPILRRGSTAAHPAIDWQGRSRGVLDIGAYPGSSGSPVLIHNTGPFATRNGIAMGSRTYLLGILSSTPIRRVDGEIVIETIPTTSLPIARTTLPFHLGYYIKARELTLLARNIAAQLHQGMPL